MENIQVALRVRPLSKKEIFRGEENVWAAQNNTITLHQNSCRDILSTKRINLTTRMSFPFDYVFSAEENNIQVYSTMVKRIALSSLNGINGTIFMYGQTGSGKTYTMMGYRQDENDNGNTNGMNSAYGNIPTSPRLQIKMNSMKSPTRIEEKLPNDNGSNEDCYETYDKPQILTNENSSSTGILIQALRDIFNTIENDLDKTYFLKCSYVEIYNDQIYDLLKSHDKLGETLTVNEDPKRDFYIKGVIEESVSSISEILDKLRKGEVNRHYAATMMNHSSSRSHTIFRLSVQTVTNNFIRDYRRECFKQSNNTNDGNTKISFENKPPTNVNMHTFTEETLKKEGTMVTESLLNFVDLAGSEKVSNHHMMFEDPAIRELSTNEGAYHGKDTYTRSSSIKDRVKEGQHINKSLFFLTQVISLKSEGKSSQHIPYRNSPLTKILRSSLGGNSRTLIILCMTPAGSQLEQSMSTLRFGMNAKKIENKVQANIITNNDDEALKILIADYEKKIRDFENNRQEDQHKCHALMRQIEDLQQQKAKIMERFNNMCKIQLNKFAESISPNELRKFFEQVQEKLIYFPKAGILFNSSKLTKYDKLYKKNHNSKEKGTKSRSPIQRRKKKSSLLNQQSDYENDIEDMDSENEDNLLDKKAHGFFGGSGSGNGNGSGNGIGGGSDSRTKYALLAVRSTKKQNSTLLKKISVLEDQYKEIVQKYLQKCAAIIDYEYKIECMSKQFKELASRFCGEIDENSKIQKEVKFYKELKGIQDLNDEELLDLENQYLKRVDEIKSEKVLRQYKNEINNLRLKLNMSIIESTPTEDEHTEANILRKNLITKEVLDQTSVDNQFNFTGLTEDEIQSLKTSHIVSEEQAIWNNHNTLMSQINQEIAEASKIVEENSISKLEVTLKHNDNTQISKIIQKSEELGEGQVERPEVEEEEERRKREKGQEEREGEREGIIIQEIKPDLEDQAIPKPSSNNVKLDIGFFVLDYEMNSKKHTKESKMQEHEEQEEEYHEGEVIEEYPKLRLSQDNNFINTQIISTQLLENGDRTPRQQLGDDEISEFKMDEIELNCISNSTMKLHFSKQASPSHRKMISASDCCEYFPKNNQYERTSNESISNINTKESMESFYSSASKSNLLKSSIQKSVLNQNTYGLSKITKPKQVEKRDTSRSKPLNPINLNSSINNMSSSRKNSKSSLDISRNKSPTPIYYHSLIPKEKDNNSLSDTYDTQNRKSKLNKSNVSTNDNPIGLDTDKIQYLNDSISIGKFTKTYNSSNYKTSNKENYSNEKVNIGSNSTRSQIMDQDESMFTNSIFSIKAPERSSSVDINLLKFNTGFNYSSHLKNPDDSSPLRQDHEEEFYQNQAPDQDTRKRRSRAERAGKNRA